MKLFHVTLRQNADSILQSGLEVWRAKGDLKACWLVSKRRVAWAIDHVCKRHKVRPEEVGIFSVRVKRDDVRRFHSRGIWYSRRDVGPSLVVSYQTYEEMVEEFLAIGEDHAARESAIDALSGGDSTAGTLPLSPR